MCVEDIFADSGFPPRLGPSRTAKSCMGIRNVTHSLTRMVAVVSPPPPSRPPPWPMPPPVVFMSPEGLVGPMGSMGHMLRLYFGSSRDFSDILTTLARDRRPICFRSMLEGRRWSSLITDSWRQVSKGYTFICIYIYIYIYKYIRRLRPVLEI